MSKFRFLVIPSHSLDDLPLILGLSLGIGIPVAIGIAGGFIYYFKIVKPKQKVIPDNNPTNTTTAALVDIPMVPINTANDNNVGTTEIV
jgi:hypothetical protein